MAKARRQTRPVNRRRAMRDHLLDVKIRTSTARRQRREKATKWVINILLLAIVLVGSVYGVRVGLKKFFFENPEYSLRKITTDLDNVFTREELLAETGLREGTNIFRVDLTKIEEVLREVPQVATVEVVRNLPDEIEVRVTARRPVAWVSANDTEGADPRTSENSLLVDATGFLMKPRHVLPEYLTLPVIYGVHSDHVRNGESLHADDLRRSLELLETVSKNPASLLSIRSMDISKGYCIEVVNDSNSRISFGMDDFPEQLVRLEKLLAHCREGGRQLDSVNLMVKRNTPVTFLVASTPVAEETEAQIPAKKAGKMH